jgi:hypothetical protein
MEIDYYFNYKNIMRNLSIKKFNSSIKNSYSVPVFGKLQYVFSLRNYIDIDDFSIFNCIFLLRQFFGERSFITGYKTSFDLGIYYYNFDVIIVFNKNEVFLGIYYYFLSLSEAIKNNKILKYNKIKNYSKDKYYLSVKILNMNIFTDKVITLGLFNLKDKLNIRFFFFKSNYTISKFLVSCLKLDK